MILCKITDKKDFMNKFLAGDCFYSFLLKDASILGFVPLQIEGRINKAFFSEEDPDAAHFLLEEYASWSDIRPICFDFIKGKRTPTRFQFVLYLKSDALNQLLLKENLTKESSLVQNLILNIKYEQGEISITSGVDYSSFTLDKQAEHLWDQTLMKFLNQKQIAYTIE